MKERRTFTDLGIFGERLEKKFRERVGMPGAGEVGRDVRGVRKGQELFLAETVNGPMFSTRVVGRTAGRQTTLARAKQR
ncbi:MAG: hypothetical protein NVSMB9_27500 [Isosphaeraceae bacterium]